jgi:hypothetical protein
MAPHEKQIYLSRWNATGCDSRSGSRKEDSWLALVVLYAVV